jgi:hypothetical protein
MDLNMAGMANSFSLLYFIFFKEASIDGSQENNYLLSKLAWWSNPSNFSK